MKKPQPILTVIENEIVEDISDLGHFVRVSVGFLYALACILVMYASVGIVALFTDILAVQVGLGVVLGFAVAKAPILLIQWLEDSWRVVTRVGHIRAYGVILAVLAIGLGAYWYFAPAHWRWHPKFPAPDHVTTVPQTVQPVPALAPAAVLPDVRPLMTHLKRLHKPVQRKRHR
jgi:hypothetical protein